MKKNNPLNPKIIVLGCVGLFYFALLLFILFYKEDPVALCEKGDIYYDNHNYVEAVKCYRKAAEQGNIVAQHNLGDMYEKGDGVAKNYTEAVKWYRKAAEQGGASAQKALKRMGYDYKIDTP
ncbi:tetratricopeptide repeat protein [Viscerimonas tarda]